MDALIFKKIEENTDKIYKKIDDFIAKKSSISFVFSSATTDWTTQISPPIILDNKDNYEIGLVNLETYYSFPNISASLQNNSFVYNNGTTTKTITIPDGSYDITDINNTIQQGMQKNGDSTDKNYFISLLVNNATLKSIVNITKKGYTVDFTGSNSLRNLLGFNSVVLQEGYNISTNIVNILNTNTIQINCNIISGSYNNGSQSTVLYSYFPSVAPGYKIIQTPVNIVYLPLVGDHIFSIRIWITDQNGNIMDFRGEVQTLRLHLRRKL